MFKLLFVCMATLVAVDAEFKLLSAHPLKHAAVASVVPSLPPLASSPTLVTTTFGPLPSENSVAALVNGSFTSIDSSVVWPNEVELVASGTIPSLDADAASLIVAGGFFASPFESTGNIQLIFPGQQREPVTLSVKDKGKFYHKTVWYDVNGDGRMDILSARGVKPKQPGELIWLSQPENSPLSGPWTETVIATGPDVGFTISSNEALKGAKGAPGILAAEAFTQKLVLLQCSEPLWSECSDAHGLTRTVIDDTIGLVFQVSELDVDGDGQLDLLVTAQGQHSGGILAFSLASDGSWKRHTLADGMKPIHSWMPGSGSPGAFTTSTRNGLSILLSGDDGGFAALLTRSTKGSFEFGVDIICNSTGTVGQLALAEQSEEQALVFVPYYSEGRVEVYSWAA